MADGADVAYSFPMLNSKRIVGYLGDLNIHVSEQVSRDTEPSTWVRRSTAKLHTTRVRKKLKSRKGYRTAAGIY